MALYEFPGLPPAIELAPVDSGLPGDLDHRGALFHQGQRQGADLLDARAALASSRVLVVAAAALLVGRYQRGQLLLLLRRDLQQLDDRLVGRRVDGRSDAADALAVGLEALVERAHGPVAGGLEVLAFHELGQRLEFLPEVRRRHDLGVRQERHHPEQEVVPLAAPDSAAQMGELAKVKEALPAQAASAL